MKKLNSTQAAAKAKKSNVKASTKKAEQPKATTKAKAEPKEKKVPLSKQLDELILKGGKWADLMAAGDKVAKDMKLKTRFTTAVLKQHINWRTKVQKNPDYLGDLVLTEEGIMKKVVKKAKVNKVA